MDTFYCFLIVGSALVLMILHFDRQQRLKVSRMSKDVSNVQPLFLLRSTEQKLIAIKTMLYGRINGSVISGQVDMNKGARQYIASQLDSVLASYKNNEITLKEYQNKLTALHRMIYEVKDMSFEQVS